MTTTPFLAKVSSLNQGISKQAAALRFPSQVADAENIDFTVVDGSRKRPGGETIAVVGGVQANSTYRMHKIERDDQEEYAVLYGPQVGGVFIEVLDLATGTTATVTVTDNATDYLGDNGATVDDLRFVTIADTTFIVNTKKPTATKVVSGVTEIDADTMPIRLTRTGTAPLAFEITKTPFTARGKYQQVLSSSSDASVSGEFRLRYKPGSGNYDTALLPYYASAEDVELALQGDGTSANPGIDPFPYGKVICTGGPLPAKPIYINISSDLDVDRVMTVVSSTISGATYSVAGGTDDRDPPPQFIRSGLPIRDITFFRNRLCFASDEFLAFSRSDDVYGFFLGTPIAVTDADPIELQISATDVNVIDNVTPFRNSLVVLTKSGRQFELKVDGPFTAETAAITQSTAYDTQQAKPTMIGNRLYMAGSNDRFSSMLEYYYEDSFATNTATVISEHVDTLIPPAIKRLDACPINQQVFVFPAITGDIIGGAVKISELDGIADFDGSDEFDELTTWVNDDPPVEGDDVIITDTHVVTFDGYYTVPGFTQLENPSGVVSELYVYRTRSNGAERVQSAWSRWTFGADAIMDMFVIDDRLYVMRRQTSLVDSAARLKVDRFNLGGSRSPNFAGFEREVHLDHMIQKTGTPSDGDTVFTLDADESDLSRDTAVDSDGNEYVITQNGDGSQVTISGVEIGSGVVLGRRFKSEVVLGEVLMRSPQNQPIEAGRLVLSKMFITYTSSGPFSVDIESVINGVSIADRSVAKGSTSVDTGVLSVPVFGRARDTVITIGSTNSWPTTFTSLEYHGTHSTNLE